MAIIIKSSAISILPLSLVNTPVLGTNGTSSFFIILKLAFALPESGSVKYASKECSPSARVFKKLAGRVIVWSSGSTSQ